MTGITFRNQFTSFFEARCFILPLFDLFHRLCIVDRMFRFDIGGFLVDQTRWLIRTFFIGIAPSVFSHRTNDHEDTHGGHTQSQAIAQTAHAFAFGAMLAAEEGSCLLEAVTNNANAAMCACRRQSMDRALEAVEDMGCTVLNHLKRLVVVVPTGFADRHDASPIAV